MKLISSFVFTGCADGSGGPTCCTSSHQCGEGEGDCDKDVDCAGDLKCGQGNGLDDNCDTSLGFPGDYDCCYDPNNNWLLSKKQFFYYFANLFDMNTA